MDNNKLNENISKIINDAINNMNFNDISQKIKTSLDQTLRSTINLIDKNKSNLPRIQTKNPKICAQKLPEKAKSSGFKILSIILFALGLMLSLGFMIEGLDYLNFTDILAGLMLGFGSIFAGGFFFKRAKHIDKISKNYIRFLRELGRNTVIPIIDLASSVQQTEEDTIKDLMYMMKNGYFHQGRIVENDSLFLLDIETFKLYKSQLKNTSIKEEKNQEISKTDQKAYEIIDKSQIYIKQIDNSKQKIKNQIFLEKVEKVRNTTENIINIIKKHKDKAYVLDKFMDYYLPTTAKLIDTYIEFEQMDTDDKKILNSMAEIEKSIETINEAYEKIQVELLSDRAMDIKTDIDTIKLLLNQEGLINNDWSEK